MNPDPDPVNDASCVRSPLPSQRTRPRDAPCVSSLTLLFNTVGAPPAQWAGHRRVWDTRRRACELVMTSTTIPSIPTLAPQQLLPFLDAASTQTTLVVSVVACLSLRNLWEGRTEGWRRMSMYLIHISERPKIRRITHSVYSFKK